MDYFHRILFKNHYPDWMITELEKKPATPVINPDTGLHVKKDIFISVPYVPGLCEEFRRIFCIPVYKASSKEPTPLNLSVCTPDKIASHLKQNIV